MYTIYTNIVKLLYTLLYVPFRTKIIIFSFVMFHIPITNLYGTNAHPCPTNWCHRYNVWFCIIFLWLMKIFFLDSQNYPKTLPLTVNAYILYYIFYTHVYFSIFWQFEKQFKIDNWWDGKSVGHDSKFRIANHQCQQAY